MNTSGLIFSLLNNIEAFLIFGRLGFMTALIIGLCFLFCYFGDFASNSRMTENDRPCSFFQNFPFILMHLIKSLFYKSIGGLRIQMQGCSLRRCAAGSD